MSSRLSACWPMPVLRSGTFTSRNWWTLTQWKTYQFYQVLQISHHNTKYPLGVFPKWILVFLRVLWSLPGLNWGKGKFAGKIAMVDRLGFYRIRFLARHLFFQPSFCREELHALTLHHCVLWIWIPSHRICLLLLRPRTNVQQTQYWGLSALGVKFMTADCSSSQSINSQQFQSASFKTYLSAEHRPNFFRTVTTIIHTAKHLICVSINSINFWLKTPSKLGTRDPRIVPY